MNPKHTFFRFEGSLDPRHLRTVMVTPVLTRGPLVRKLVAYMQSQWSVSAEHRGQALTVSFRGATETDTVSWADAHDDALQRDPSPAITGIDVVSL